MDKTKNFSNGLNLFVYCLNNPIKDSDTSGTLSWWQKLLIGFAFIIAGAIVTAITCGTGTGFLTAFSSALLTSTLQATISTAISTGIGALAGGISSAINGGSFWQGALNSLSGSAIDGFMWGGIFAGGAQILSGGFKGLAKLGVKTGKHGGIRNTGILSPNRLKNASEIATISLKKQYFYDYGGTILKFTKNFHIDVSTKSFLHLSFNFFGKNIKHFPLGTIIAGIIGGF